MAEAWLYVDSKSTVHNIIEGFSALADVVRFFEIFVVVASTGVTNGHSGNKIRCDSPERRRQNEDDTDKVLVLTAKSARPLMAGS